MENKYEKLRQGYINLAATITSVTAAEAVSTKKRFYELSHSFLTHYDEFSREEKDDLSRLSCIVDGLVIDWIEIVRFEESYERFSSEIAREIEDEKAKEKQETEEKKEAKQKTEN